MTSKGNKEKSANLFDNVGTSAFLLMHSTVLSSAASSPRSFDFEPEAEQVYGVDEVQQVDEMEEVDQMGQMDEMGNMEQGDEEEEVEQVEEVEEEGQLDQVEQEARSPSNAAAGISDEVPVGVLLHIIVWTTNPAKPWISTLVFRFTLQKASYFYHYFCHTGFSDAAENPVDPSKQGGWRFFK